VPPYERKNRGGDAPKKESFRREGEKEASSLKSSGSSRINLEPSKENRLGEGAMSKKESQQKPKESHSRNFRCRAVRGPFRSKKKTQ